MWTPRVWISATAPGAAATDATAWSTSTITPTSWTPNKRKKRLTHKDAKKAGMYLFTYRLFLLRHRFRRNGVFYRGNQWILTLKSDVMPLYNMNIFKRER
jgi:hypothetical protein